MAKKRVIITKKGKTWLCPHCDAVFFGKHGSQILYRHIKDLHKTKKEINFSRLDKPACIKLQDKHISLPSKVQSLLDISMSRSSLYEALSFLEPRVQFILCMRFGFFDGPLTLAEVANCFNPRLTRERIRQIELDGLRQLRVFFKLEPPYKKGMFKKTYPIPWDKLFETVIDLPRRIALIYLYEKTLSS